MLTDIAWDHLLQASLIDSDPSLSQHDSLIQANNLKLQLKTLDQEWLKSQELFYEDDLILYGAGTNITIDPELLSVLTIEDLF